MICEALQDILSLQLSRVLFLQSIVANFSRYHARYTASLNGGSTETANNISNDTV